MTILLSSHFSVDPFGFDQSITNLIDSQAFNINNITISRFQDFKKNQIDNPLIHVFDNIYDVLKVLCDSALWLLSKSAHPPGHQIGDTAEFIDK